MDSVSNTVTIRGPVAAVFDLVTSARFWKRWHPATKSVGGVVERPYQLGDVIHEQGQIAGVPFSVLWTIVEHDRPSRVVMRSAAPPAAILYGFSETDGAIVFTREVQYEPAVFDALGQPREAIRQFMHAQSEQALGQLNVLVEEILAAETAISFILTRTSAREANCAHRTASGARVVRLAGVTLAFIAVVSAVDGLSQGTVRWTPARTVNGQPDLQGVWANRSVTPLERPEALANRKRLTDEEVRTLKARADRLFSTSDNDFLAGDNIFLAALANLEHVRNPNATGTVLDMVDREFDNRTSLIVDPPDGRIPALTSAGQRRTAAALAGTLAIPWQLGEDIDRVASAARRPQPGGPEDLSNALRCLTWGVPRIAGNARYDSHYQILQTRTHVVLLSEVNGPRIIPLDGSPHLAAGLRQLNGDSRGHWEAATLVIDTTNFSPNSYFMGSAERLHLVERFTRTAPETIEYRMTLDDPTTWTKPWTAMIRLRRTTDRIYEFACHEGNHYVIEGILSHARAQEKSE